MIQITKDLERLARVHRKQRHLMLETLSGLGNLSPRFLSEFERGKETAEIGKVLQALRTLGRLGFQDVPSWITDGDFAPSGSLPLANRTVAPEARIAHQSFANLLPKVLFPSLIRKPPPRCLVADPPVNPAQPESRAESSLRRC